MNKIQKQICGALLMGGAYLLWKKEPKSERAAEVNPLVSVVIGVIGFTMAITAIDKPRN